MATLVFTALGTALGGPLGGALGSLVGNQLDRAVAGSASGRAGRLKELSVTTSSYGTAVPRHHGTMRAAGSIIWATDLVETTTQGGGGKGKPATSGYSYSASFAVALASRPIAGLGRIWADGNLLRGAEGDLKSGGELRIYTGHGDQPADPLIAADKGAGCPAFRDLAYCVFEGLQLADFGNRLPALTFEIIADKGAVMLTQLVEPLGEAVEAHRPLEGLTGFSNDGGPLTATLATIDQVYPIALDVGGRSLSIRAADDLPDELPMLAEPTVDPDEDSFGAAAGSSRRRQPDRQDIPEGLRYYDIGRDYQPGLQRPQGRARPGRQHIIEFPGALDAANARALASTAAERAGWSRETLVWRTAELDPAVGPGSVVCVPDDHGAWRVEAWEWRERGVELELRRLHRKPPRQIRADAGAALRAPDRIARPTLLQAFELPHDSINDTASRRVFAAASSTSDGWRGAALFLQEGSDLVPLGSTGLRRSILGTISADLPPSPALILERSASVEVQLAAADLDLSEASPAMIAGGANRALIGEEIVQFARAENLGGARWRLGGLLRGRGGTEAQASRGHRAGAPFVLIDGPLVALDSARLAGPGPATLAALGLGDSVTVTAEIANPGFSVRPMMPVHARTAAPTQGGAAWTWTRRARGAWGWLDQLETPLGEPVETYVVGLGPVDQPVASWELDQPRIELAAGTLADLRARHPGQPLWVRQIGLHGLSDPLLLTILG